MLLLSHLLQPCPLSSPCCWPASTAAATPGSICASQGICSRILGRIFCAVLLTTSNHPSAAVSMNLTQVTRASPQTLQLRAMAAKRASHRPRQHKYRPPPFPFPSCPLCLTRHAVTHKTSSSSTSPDISHRGQKGKTSKVLIVPFTGPYDVKWKLNCEIEKCTDKGTDVIKLHWGGHVPFITLLDTHVYRTL